MKRYFSFAFLVLTALAAGDRNPAALEVISGGYPRAFFFRSAESFAANPKTSYEAWEKAFGRLMGIEGKALEEEVPGRSRNIAVFTKFKEQHPRQLVMLHYNGNARDPRDQHGKFFAGHWLYYNGAKILSDISAEGSESVIRVSDPTLFVTNMGRFKNANEDIGLCALDANGKPDWKASEQVQLLAVDKTAGTIRVKRGQFGTAARAFSANRAYAAAHVTEGPWGNSANLLWDYNHSTACPRDDAAHTCDDVLIDDLTRHFRAGGDLAALDGLEFDVLKYTLGGKRSGKRGIDTNGDGIADGGTVDGTDRYAEGTVAFCRRLREQLGENTLILADGWSVGNQRAFGILNGIEAEGWPSLNDYQVLDWSGGLNRQSFWAANSRAPAFNYINHKFNVKGEILGSDSPLVPYSTDRLVFAGAMFTDSAICYSLRPPTKPGELIGIWDELWMGTEHRLGWLGKPTGPPVHVASSAPDLLGGRGVRQVRGDAVSVRGNEISAKDPQAKQLEFEVAASGAASDLWLSMTMKAAESRAVVAHSARLFRTGLAGSDEGKSYGWTNAREFTYTFYFPEAKGAAMTFSIEGSEPVWITSLTAHAAPDAMYREFENGLVIANPSPHPYRFDLAKLFPGRSYRRLKGTPEQDPKANDGSPVAGAVELGPKDALFLVRMK